MRYHNMVHWFQFNQNEGVATWGVEGRGLGWTHSRLSPAC